VNERNILWWTPQICGKEYEFIAGVLDSNYLNDGDVTERFERRIGELLGVKHVIAVTSGTAAISLGLAAVGVKPGDEVIVPDLTFVATANAASMLGAKVVLVDIDPRTLNMDPASFERAITPMTRAVVPVHVSGRPADMDSILKIAATHGLAVVEDAAEGFLSKHSSGRCLGGIGDCGCLSFSPNKTITSGQGGAVLTNDDRLHDRLRELKDQGRRHRGTGGDDLHPTVGYNFKFTNLQAAVGLAQLECLDARLERLRNIYCAYARSLKGLDGIYLPGFDLSSGESPQWTDAVIERRNELDRYLEERNVHCRRFWFPLHTQAPYRRPADGFPNAARVGPKCIWLPSAFTLSEADVSAVCGHIRDFVEGRG
jgi:perosamine synthetase